jgi:hypothetical protein
MLSFFSDIAAVITHLPAVLLASLENLLNIVIAAIGTTINALLSLVPSLPDPPVIPTGDWIGWLNWLFPVGACVDSALGSLLMFLAYLALRIALRWVKAD